jgi:peptidoglycan/LPS O-acetylase OafA/YrhL
MNHFRYRPEIDGLRAIAVLAVLFFHANRLLPGGYAGVDVFFVISGFLITSLIQKDLQADNLRLADFWERRVRRIFPALALMVGAVLAAGIVFMLPGDLHDLARSATSQSLLSSNLYFWSTIDYFSGPAELKPLLHTWSLAVEEQFYLLFPLLLVACRRMPRTKLLGMVGLLAAVSLILSALARHPCPQATFFLLPARAWELLTGALVALAPPQSRPARRWNEIGSALGLAGIGAAYFFYNDSTRFPGVAALLPCLGAAAIIYCNGSGSTVVGKGLALKPLVAIGLVSYSLYLWHWPIFAFYRYLADANLSSGHCVLAVGASSLAAGLSWKFVELPFRRRREECSRARVFSTALSVSAALLAVSVVAWCTGGLPTRFSREVLDLATAEVVPEAFNLVQVEQIEKDELPVLGDRGVAGDCASFLLWGDSHSRVLSPLLDELARERGVYGFMASRSGTVPLLETWDTDQACVAWNRAVLDFIRRKEIRNVILVARWSMYIEGRPNGTMDPLIVDSQSRAKTTDESRRVLHRGLEHTIAELRRAGARVWIVRQVPEQKEDARRTLVRAALLHGMSSTAGVSLADHRRRQARADAVLIKHQADDVQLLDPAEFCLSTSGMSQIGGEGRSYYRDDNHLTPHGAARLLRPMFEPCMTQFVDGSSRLASREARAIR